MKQNPFSLYDFLGYVFPGLITIYLFFFLKNVTSFDDIQSILDGLKAPFMAEDSGTLISSIEDTFLLIICAYVVGHFVAYLSSITIEQFSIWVYGYPSQFLLEDIPNKRIWSASDEPNLKRRVKLIWRVIICIVLLPISVATLLIGKLCKVKYFFVKKLDRQLIETIKKNQMMLADYLGMNITDDMDFHRVIYHYEYELQERHHVKMDNYVALYGFLRALALISNCTFIWILLFHAIPSINIESSTNWFIICLLLILWFVTYIFFMGFMKFYRRFTLESFMCLITDTSYKKTEAVSISQYNYVSTHSTTNTTRI